MTFKSNVGKLDQALDLEKLEVFSMANWSNNLAKKLAHERMNIGYWLLTIKWAVGVKHPMP